MRVDKKPPGNYCSGKLRSKLHIPYFLQCLLICAAAVFLLQASSMPMYAAEKFGERWQYSKDINLSGNTRYKAVYLDQEVYGNSLDSLADIRVLDKNGETVSYYLKNNYSLEKRDTITYSTERTAAVLERDEKLKKYDTIFDFRALALAENADIQANRMILSVNGANFYKEIELYGSFDGVVWNYITKENIYRVDNVSRTEIGFREYFKYRFYRIKVLNNLENVSIERLQLVNESLVTSQLKNIGNTVLDFERKEEDKNTILTVKNSSRLKLKSLTLDTEGIFNRRYEVFLKTGQVEMRTGYRGSIYNLNFKSLSITDNTIDFSPGPASSDEITIKIMNNDDRPLDIKGINAEYHIDKLVFEDIGKAPYRLVFGNQDAVRPSYDIEKYRQHIEAESQDICTLGGLAKVNGQSEKSKTWIEKNTALIFNVVIGIVSLALIALIIFRLKSKNND